MKNVVKLLVTAFLVCSLQSFAMAMDLGGESKTVSPVYTPTSSAVEKTLKKMGIKFSVDKDGDLYYKMKEKDYRIYVIFNKLSSGRLWNIQLVSQFGTKKSRYDELLKYANKWNTDKKFPKVVMKDEDSMRCVLNFPVQYGYNPDEFEENGIAIFERTLKMIAKDTYAMRR